MRRILTPVMTAASTCLAILSPVTARAAVFDGGGLGAGIGAASGIAGLSRQDLWSLIANVLIKVVSFMALAAVVAVVVAGIYLIVGQGSDESKEKAKKIILYCLIGLLIILFARVIVGFVTLYLPTVAN